MTPQEQARKIFELIKDECPDDNYYPYHVQQIAKAVVRSNISIHAEQIEHWGKVEESLTNMQ